MSSGGPLRCPSPSPCWSLVVVLLEGFWTCPTGRTQQGCTSPRTFATAWSSRSKPLLSPSLREGRTAPAWGEGVCGPGEMDYSGSHVQGAWHRCPSWRSAAGHAAGHLGMLGVSPCPPSARSEMRGGGRGAPRVAEAAVPSRGTSPPCQAGRIPLLPAPGGGVPQSARLGTFLD